MQNLREVQRKVMKVGRIYGDVSDLEMTVPLLYLGVHRMADGTKLRIFEDVLDTGAYPALVLDGLVARVVAFYAQGDPFYFVGKRGIKNINLQSVRHSLS